MVQDLSHLADGSMTATSQHSGGQVAENHAMTAPGSPSLSVDQADVQPAPSLEAAPGPDPRDVVTGRAHDARPELPDYPGSVIRRGQWNTL